MKQWYTGDIVSQLGVGQVIADLFRAEGSALALSRSTTLNVAEVKDTCFFVEEGYLVACLTGVGTDASRNYIYSPGDICNLETITESLPVRHDTQLEVITAARVYSLPMCRLLEVIRSQPDVNLEILRYMAVQLRCYNDRIENLSYTYASDKLIYRLLYLAARFGVRKGRRVVIKVPLTHRQIGSSINLRRESVSRELDKLAQKGLVKYHKGTISLPDISRLTQSFYEERRTDWSELLDLAGGQEAAVKS